jgi:alkaline phosphatase
MNSRRVFLQRGAIVVAGAAFARSAQAAPDKTAQKPLVRIGMVTDLHYADKPPAGSRHYRETLRKFAEADKQFADDNVDFVVELGDFIDAADSLETEKTYLTTIAQRFAARPGKRHYVLGNHCVYALTKGEFLEIVGQPKSCYSFDLGGYHFIVLDACFRSDGEPYGRKNFEWTDSNIPAAETEWLTADLAKTPHKTIAFVHQRLDVEGHYGVKNAVEVLRVFERSGKVLAVFQGHYHRNDLREIGGIHYCTLAAMVEGAGPDSSAYAVVDILPGEAIRITGFRTQKSYRW